MSKPIKNNCHILSILAQIKSPKLLKILIQESDDSLIYAITEFAHNRLKEGVAVVKNKSANKRFITAHHTALEKLSNKEVSVTVKRKHLIKLGPEFVCELIAPLLGVLDG